MNNLRTTSHHQTKLFGLLRLTLCSLILTQIGTALNATPQSAAPVLLTQANAEDTKGTISPDSLIERDVALNVTVTLTVKAQPLEVLLANLQKQSGVRFAPDPAALKVRRLVTARVKDIPLSTFLGSLTRMYGVEWVKDADKSYIMRNGKMNDLQRSLLAIGEPHWYRNRHQFEYSLNLEKQRQGEIAQYMYKQLGSAALTSPEGVAFTSLPEEWRPEIRRITQMPRAEALIRERRLLDQVFSRPLFLYLGTTAPDIAVAPGISLMRGNAFPLLTLRDENGRYVGALGDLSEFLIRRQGTTTATTNH